MMKTNNVFGYNGIAVNTVARDTFENDVIITLDSNIINLINSKVSIDYVDCLGSSINNIVNTTNTRIDDLINTCESLRKENEELRKILARLNTRVNDIIAKEQVKEFYEKSNRECEVARC